MRFLSANHTFRFAGAKIQTFFHSAKKSYKLLGINGKRIQGCLESANGFSRTDYFIKEIIFSANLST